MRADRLLSILLLLQLHGRMTARELAKRLEVSLRTIHRDMEALGAAGVPVVADRGARGGWSLMEGYRTNLTGLTDAEVRALFVMTPARILSDLRLEKASDAALVKLLSVLPSVTRRNAEFAKERIHIDVSGWSRSKDPVPFLPLLQDAVWRERRVRMLYGDIGCLSERVIDPLGLVAKGSAWYLVAAIDGDIRSYRVSRVREATILDETFARPQNFDLARFWEESSTRFKERLPRYEVVIRAAQTALSWISALTRFGGVDKVEEEKDGLVRVAMHFDAEEVARAVIAGFGDQVEVIEPAALRAGVVNFARATINRYEA